MEQLPVDQTEMELRKDQDFNALLKMIGEGSPIHEIHMETMDQLRDFQEHELPPEYQ
ncbi:hypothetical protein FITA111629_11930 [Filibacter tadaridae]|uniref:Uncharacterized protein n=1 Tax=Filibacter tadaridae TaxID=2483811 RepID=A0A3P5WSU6_9BACL|nr:hypothetical protein [Filibacter tadaridae]VDC18194.1 hypothetical protein FILTAD_00115 [Filibacter tadaridae]